LELGGNDAAIVLDDVDPKKVAPGIFAGAFTNAGQVCIALKRFYVHEDVYDEICDELTGLANAAIVDDGLKQGTTMGPLQNRKQFEKVKILTMLGRTDASSPAAKSWIVPASSFGRPLSATSRMVRNSSTRNSSDRFFRS
jgi:acyl-CoA reductase-like NAD-dependent aldehyde dehydrogenase